MKTPDMGNVSVQPKTTIYNKFKGVDFASDAALVSAGRSPYSVNMISDSGGMPEKRPGTRTLWQLEGKVHTLFYGVVGDGDEVFLTHAGTKLYRWYTDESTEPEVIKSEVSDIGGCMISMGGKIWIFTGAEYLVYGKFDNPDYVESEGNEKETLQIKSVSEMAYVPVTAIGREPSGGGATLDAINLLQAKRKNKFRTNGTDKVYQLDATKIDSVESVEIDDKVTTISYTVDTAKGTLTFTSAPSTAATQEDNMVVTFSKNVDGNAEKIAKCRFCTSYGVGSADRIFISGNPEHKNSDWYSELNDPTYFSDLSYSNIGSEETAIMGYRKIGSNLAVIKEDNGQDNTIYMRSYKYDSETVTFPITPGVSGVGAIASASMGTLLDEPLYLSGTGVYAITSNDITAEKTVKNRSYFIDPRLTAESGLQNAKAVVWKGFYILCCNSHCYLLDGKQDKTYKNQASNSYVYECYYWENVPATAWLNHKHEADEDLFFGTDDGKICRFNSDIDDMSRYSDDGEAINAVWSTKADDDGDATRLKTMQRKGCAVTLKPYSRSSAEIFLRTDKDVVPFTVRSGVMDIFDWGDIDFERFTFNANDGPQEIFLRKKQRKYKRLQIVVKNSAVNEGFGIYAITKHFTVNGFAKK